MKENLQSECPLGQTQSQDLTNYGGERWSFGGNGHIVGSTGAHRKEGRGRRQHSQGIELQFWKIDLASKLAIDSNLDSNVQRFDCVQFFGPKICEEALFEDPKKNHENFANLLWEAFREKNSKHRSPD